MSTCCFSSSLPDRPRALGLLLFFLVVLSFIHCGLEAGPTDTPADCPTPPAYPDTEHVFNGCHLSTLVYLARFSTAFPREQAQSIVVHPRQGGRPGPHSLALITWRGAWWCRDENFGVFPLNCTVTAERDPERLSIRAGRRCEEHSRAVFLRLSAALRPVDAPQAPTDEQRIYHVLTAARMIPFPHTIYRVRDGPREVPLLFFRPGRGVVAIYDPAHGTGVAECTSRDDVRIVAHAARLMGYKVDSVRAGSATAVATLVADARMR